MQGVKKGDKVSINYTGKLDNQVIFDSTENRGPFIFVVGNNDLIPKFEDSLIDMNIGETKTVKIKCADAYGRYSEEYLFDMPIEEFPKDIPLVIGTPMQMQQENGMITVVKIKDITDKKVVVDANHPLAGQDLTFDISLIEILK